MEWTEPRAPVRGQRCGVSPGTISQDLRELADRRRSTRSIFLDGSISAVNVDVSVTITESALCHGWAGWFDIKLADQWLSTSPRARRTHWSPAFLPLDPPMAVTEGDRVDFHLARPPFGEWVWWMKSPTGMQRHSTLFSTPIKATTLQKASVDYTPTLTAEGQAIAYVLSQCDGVATTRQIALSLQEHYSDRYPTPPEAIQFVQAVLKRHA